MEKIADQNGEWATAIGRAILAFGSIEHVTVACLRTIPRDHIQRSTSRLNLAPRIELLLEILEAHPGEPFSNLSEKLGHAKELAKTRNVIAHNPLVFQIYERGDGGYVFTEAIAALHKEGHTMSLAELQDFAVQAEKLVSELYDCSMKVFAALRSPLSA